MAVPKEMCVPFKAPLNKGDTESQTKGCRANNPDICAFNLIEGVCAFSSSDGICKHPSKAWKKQYYKLLEEK